MNNILNFINNQYPNRIIIPNSLNEIPQNGYMVYILTYNEKPIVLGHGRKNRARVIFDNVDQITTSHFKTLLVRLHILFGNGNFAHYIITCNSKDEAKQVENNLHKTIGGNKREVPQEILKKLFDNIHKDSMTYLVLQIALRSSFDGLSDLRKWRNDGLLNDKVWSEISNKLQLI